MGRQNSNLRKIGSRPGPLADWNVGASVGTGAGVATTVEGDVCDCIVRKLARISFEYKQSRTLIRILLYILLEWKI
jgi:hypothetical protein